MELLDKGENVCHLAGIVPVASTPLDFNMPWHDCLMPIAPDYLAVERAIYECALAGCETIWVVSHLGIQPLLKKRIGEFITDPVSINTPYWQERKKTISIFYVPIHPKDRDKRDCLSWSVLYGADTAFRIAAFLSKWVLPEKFYCAFPYGIIPDESIKAARGLISKRKQVMFSHHNKKVSDNLHMSFTFGAEQYKKCRDIIRQQKLTEWDENSGPLYNRSFSKYYSIGQVFSNLDVENYNVIELPWFYDISSWENYRIFLSSEESKILKRKENIFSKEKRRKFPRDKELFKNEDL
jgi:hypothetical protein